MRPPLALATSSSMMVPSVAQSTVLSSPTTSRKPTPVRFSSTAMTTIRWSSRTLLRFRDPGPSEPMVTPFLKAVIPQPRKPSPSAGRLPAAIQTTAPSSLSRVTLRVLVCFPAVTPRPARRQTRRSTAVNGPLPLARSPLRRFSRFRPMMPSSISIRLTSSASMGRAPLSSSALPTEVSSI